jgi:hypothetical protein
VQNLHYTYDPAGNITHIQDDAQQTIYFRNQRVEPSNDYTYDAVYRLIQASGREHLGQERRSGAIPIRRRRQMASTPSTPGSTIRGNGQPWAPTSSATCTTPSATSCRCSIAAVTRLMRAGRARYDYVEPSLIEDGSGPCRSSYQPPQQHTVGTQPDATGRRPTA